MKWMEQKMLWYLGGGESGGELSKLGGLGAQGALEPVA